jgi:hypothetical protein
MKDILLGNDGDIAIINNDITFTKGSQITLQKLKQKLKFFKSEWYLNNEAGIPYYEEILKKNVDLGKIEPIFIRAIQSVEEVVEILKLEITQDKIKRTLQINFAVRDVNSNIVEVTL